MTDEQRRRLDRVCARVLGRVPDRVGAFTVGPAGAERRTWRVHLPERIVYATQRVDPRVTEREAHLLRTLGARGAPVPSCLALEDGWLLQESAGEERLAQGINRLPPAEARVFLGNAIASLADIHAAGREEGLADGVPAFGQGEETARILLATLEDIARRTGRALPGFDRTAFLREVGAPGGDFIKWDARPANAACDGRGRVRFFDWQHANRRHRTDDLVWLLCDETVPEGVDPASLLFATTEAWRADADRVAAMAVAHVGVRLRGCMKGGAGLGAPWEECLAEDWLGSRESARRLARRGGAVAAACALTAPLADWFVGLAARFEPDTREGPGPGQAAE